MFDCYVVETAIKQNGFRGHSPVLVVRVGGLIKGGKCFGVENIESEGAGIFTKMFLKIRGNRRMNEVCEWLPPAPHKREEKKKKRGEKTRGAFVGSSLPRMNT